MIIKNLLTTRKKYGIIYADPPWSFNNKRTGGSLKSGAVNQYPVMSARDLCTMPVSRIADDNCVLFMWWVASQPFEALQVIGSWGFTVKTMSGFNWVKTTVKGLPAFGMGFWTRAGSELCAIAVKGNPKRVDASVRSVVLSPLRDHSQKPQVFREEIVKLMGDVQRIELFARDKCAGWDSFGNEL